MQNNVEGFNNSSKHDKYFRYLDSSGVVDKYYTLNVEKYDFSFVENSDILSRLTTIDMSCNNNTRNCFIGKDNSFNIYKRSDLSNIKIYNAKAESTNTNIRLTASETTSNNSDKVDNINIMFITKSTDPSFVFDLSGEQLNKFNLFINNENVIINGVLQGFPNNDVTTTTISGNTVSATGGSFSMGDFNFPSLMNLGFGGGVDPRLYAYMLETGNNHNYLNNYNAPFYSSFEAAMNNPSNPLVNPLNSMNPQQYSESLFGPNISPHMVKDMCKNSNLNTNSKVEREDTSTKNNNKNSGNTGNSGNTVNTGNSLANNIQNSGNPMNDIFNKMNSNSNNLLTQNSNESSSIQSNSVNNSKNSTNTINNNGSEIPPCPPCARCPQSDFECKKVPNYEQGLENSSLPRAVLTDFSTFGM